MRSSHILPRLGQWFSALAAVLDPRSAPRLARLLLAAVLARGRRTVTSWIRAAGLSHEFRPCYTTVAADAPIALPAAWPTTSFCTDVEASVSDILGLVADRFSLETMFRDVKELLGAGQQQGRHFRQFCCNALSHRNREQGEEREGTTSACAILLASLMLPVRRG